MLITPHVLVGSAIAAGIEFNRNGVSFLSTRASTVAIACGLAFTSHFLLDAVPHYDYSVYNSMTFDFYKIIFDATVAFAMGAVVFGNFLKETSLGLDHPAYKLKEPAIKDRFRHIPFLLTVIASAFASILPDIIINILRNHEGLAIMLFWQIHYFFHGSPSLTMTYGLISQGGLSIILGLYLLKLSTRLKTKLDSEQLGREVELWLSSEVKK